MDDEKIARNMVKKLVEKRRDWKEDKSPYGYPRYSTSLRMGKNKYDVFVERRYVSGGSDPMPGCEGGFTHSLYIYHSDEELLRHSGTEAENLYEMASESACRSNERKRKKHIRNFEKALDGT